MAHMSFWRYWWVALGMAFRHSLDLAQTAIFVAIIIAGLLTSFVPSLVVTVDHSGWQVATGVLVAIILIRVLMAPVWLYREQRQKILNFEQSLKSGMELVFGRESRGLGWYKSGPLRYLIQVGVRNGTPARLDDCQIQLQIITHDGAHRPDWARFMVCEPFSLRPDETKRKPILDYNFDDPAAPICIPIFDEVNNQWKRREGSLILNAGRHDIIVEALSSNTRIARLTLELKYQNNKWEIRERAASIP